MYLFDRSLADPTPEWRQAAQDATWRGRRAAPPAQRLAFMTLDRFVWSRAFLTPRLKAMIASLAAQIRASQGTMRPIGVVTLKGFTDSTGPETFNKQLGDWRAGEVKKELEALLGAEIRAGKVRVAIVIEPSTGPAPRRVDPERTNDDRERNRRVEVLIDPPTLPPDPPPPPPPPPCLDPRKCVKPPPPGPPPPIPPAPPGRSLRDWLCEKVGCTLADIIIKGGCRGLEEVFTREGGTLSEQQKEEWRQQCSGAARKPIPRGW